MLSLIQDNNILNVKETLSNDPNFLNVKHDQTNNLYIVKHCYKTNTDTQLARECDGTVLDNDAKIVCYSGEQVKLVTIDDIADLSNYDLVESLDGTIIRLYYHDNEWKTGTRGHTDARRSKWSSDKSFYELFQEALQNYPDFSTESLNTNYTYVFLLQHVDNKIICPVDKNSITLVDVYDNTTLKRVVDDSVKVDYPMTLNYDLAKLKIFLDMGELTAKGINLYHKETNERLCLLTTLYESRQKLKGNTLDMEKQYLELRASNNHYNFLKEFPEYGDMVSTLENNIRANVTHIHKLYMSKHVRQEDVTVTAAERRYLYPIHGFYLRTRNIMKRNLVENLMFVVNPMFGQSLIQA